MESREKILGRGPAAQLAQQYAAMAEQLLAQGLGRQYKDAELDEFAQTAVGLLSGSMYDIIRQRSGPKDAEAWLRRMLATTSGVVRLRGSEAMIRFDLEIKDSPNAQPRRPSTQPQATPLEPAAPVPCACRKDGQGRCTECGSKLAGALRNIVKKMADAAKEAKAGQSIASCKTCEVTQMDYAISVMVPELVEMSDGARREGEPDFAQEVMTVLYQMASAAGVREFPLTDEAMNAAEAKLAQAQKGN